MNRVLQPGGWPAPRGYSNGIAARGEQIFIAGQIGWDESGAIVSNDFVEQCAQALRNIVAILAEAGARPEHLVRLTWYVTDKAEYERARAALGAAYRSIIGDVYPAMTLVQVAALLEPGAKVEIEATAVFESNAAP